LSRFTDDPRRTADQYYVGQDPVARVSGSILEFVKTRAGHRIIDLGCGTGGYAVMLQRLGFEVTAVDSNPSYVRAAASLGVPAREADGGVLPFADKSVETVIMIEVLEHLPDDSIEGVLAEARRVARKNVVITVPDCEDADQLQVIGLTHEHFLAADHVQFFTRDRLGLLLRRSFPAVEIARGDPLFPHLLLPSIVRRPLTGLYRLGFLQPSFYSRLFAEACIDG